MIKRFIKKLLFRKEEKDLKPPFFTKDIFADKKYEIGEFTYGCPHVFFEEGGVNLHIGKFCSIAENVKIFLGGGHRMDWVTTYPFSALNDYFPDAKDIQGHPITKGSVKIGHDVWIGYGATILSGVTIGNGAVIGNGSLVTKNIGDYEVWAGNPAKFIKKRFDDQTIEKLVVLEWWNWDLAKIKKEINYLCSPPNEIR